MKTEKFKKKNYINEMTMEEGQIFFKFRSMMTDVKYNYKNDKDHSRQLWQCDSCLSAIETQSHILWCPAYQELREGKSLDNDEDLVQYITKVLDARQLLGVIK